MRRRRPRRARRTARYVPAPHWTIRRRVIFGALALCAWASIHAVLAGPELAAAVLPHTSVLAAAVIGSYVFGAAWEDIAAIPRLSDPEAMP